ncbi:hypothetical protein [Leptodesmis sp.]|uniref:hypothetical protein n=1 Tax=Leptodesmis sp. TaxID=3100501 RepID=UPI0040535032
MSGLINFIKSLFSGIFGFFGGLLGVKKKTEALSGSETKPAAKKGNSGFYLELDESKAGAAQAGSPAPAQTANGATVEAKPTEVQSAKTSRKEKLAALAEGKQPAAATPAPAKAPTAKPAAVAAPAPKPATFEPETEFATKYLVTNGSNSRRRPGANMSTYLDMARKMKVG